VRKYAGLSAGLQEAAPCGAAQFIQLNAQIAAATAAIPADLRSCEPAATAIFPHRLRDVACTFYSQTHVHHRASALDRLLRASQNNRPISSPSHRRWYRPVPAVRRSRRHHRNRQRRRIGFTSGERSFETDAAQQIERRVLMELWLANRVPRRARARDRESRRVQDEPARPARHADPPPASPRVPRQE
jgi:hypothetical protein